MINNKNISIISETNCKEEKKNIIAETDKREIERDKLKLLINNSLHFFINILTIKIIKWT